MALTHHWQLLQNDLLALPRQTWQFLNENPLIRYLIIITVFLLLCTCILNLSQKKAKLVKPTISNDEIYGDDKIGTQLDLAKAYIEMDQLNEATEILLTALQQGDTKQQLEAKQLLDKIR